jgi:predicted ester cyclase
MAVISLYGLDISDLLQTKASEPRHDMTGFDPIYADIVDYILRCTHRIWEQKDLGLIETHYSDECLIHTATGPVGGKAGSPLGVVMGTLKTLSGFPDRTLMGEAVIWSEEAKATYLSSHRITSRATNLGVSEFGPATQKRVSFTTIADCLCRANMIVEEWLVRDNSAIALQLGFRPRDIAKAQAEADMAQKGHDHPSPWREAQMDRLRSIPQTAFSDKAIPPVDDVEAFVRFVFDTVHIHKRISHIRALYWPNAKALVPGGRRLWGHGEIIGWWGAFLATFSEARLHIDHIAHVTDDGGLKIAVRWSMTGIDSAETLYGPPSQKPIWILAVTHWNILDGRILEEFTVFDDIAILRQMRGGL